MKTQLKIFRKYYTRSTVLLTLFLNLCCYTNFSHAQIIPSSCDAADSIVARYELDANQLALRKFFRDNLPEKESIEVLQVHMDTVLNAMIAVYNIDTPERDSVIDLFDVHAHDSMRRGGIGLWTTSLPVTLNDPSLDSFVVLYNMIVVDVFSNSVYVDFSSFYNQIALGNAMQQEIDAVTGFNTNQGAGRHNDIQSLIKDDHVELIYSYGWECNWTFSCLQRRYWKFKVYFDCSVEFIESYGDTDMPLNVNSQDLNTSISLYPNPVIDKLTIETNGNESVSSIEIVNMNGKRVKAYKFNKTSSSSVKNIIDVTELEPGMYFCKLTFGKFEIMRKFIKK
jgi:hypothetical protein